MDEPDLLLVCLNAFTAVLGLLSLLAGALRLLITLFPVKSRHAADAAIASAITMAVNRSVPGARVSHIEEIR